jgi:flavin-binding protein dodecin
MGILKRLETPGNRSNMTVARVTELSATSQQSFEDAVNIGVNRATSTLRNVGGAWIKDMNVMIENGSITGYQVNLAISFVIDDAQSPA